MTRLGWIDALKGFLILLVIWSHAVQTCVPDYFSTITYKTTSCFYMAAFFFVSGIVLRLGRHGVETLSGKMRRLLVPYFAWWGVNSLFCASALWFLLTLAQCVAACVICSVVVPEKKNWLWMCIGGFLLVLLALAGRNLSFDVRHFAKYYPFFLGGYLLAARKSLVAPCGGFSTIGKYEKMLLMFSTAAFVLGLVGAVLLVFTDKAFHLYKILISWFGCVSLLMIFRLLPERWAIVGVLRRIGMKTLGLYAVHIFLLIICGRYVSHWPISLLFIALSCASMIFIVVMEHIPVAAWLFLGNSPKSISTFTLKK